MGKIRAKYFGIFFFALVFQLNIWGQPEPDSLNSVKIDTTAFKMAKSPWGAVLRSALLPGFGQLYNESYWKIPIIWGTLGFLGYQWADRNDLYKKYRELYNKSISKDTPNGNEDYLNLRENYKDQRDLVAVFLGLAYFLNLVDAYVDAHLFDFDVSESFGSPSVELSIKLKL